MTVAVTEETISLIRKLPKTEIHLHFEGIASVDSIWSLVQKHRLNVGVHSKEDLRRKFAIRSLDEFIDLFINVVQACIIDPSDIDLLIRDTTNYLLRNNIRYAEIFFSPTSLLKNGLDFSSLIQRFSAGATYMQRYGITVRYLVDVSRSFGFENALHNLNLTLQHKTSDIIGLGLGGAERTGPPRDFIGVFERAREHGLKIVTHAGEVTGPQTIRDSLELLHAQRIGHGTSAYMDPQLMDWLRENQIPLEICPTSNVHTAKYVTDIKDHPIRTFYDKRIAGYSQFRRSDHIWRRPLRRICAPAKSRRVLARRNNYSDKERHICDLYAGGREASPVGTGKRDPRPRRRRQFGAGQQSLVHRTGACSSRPHPIGYMHGHNHYTARAEGVP